MTQALKPYPEYQDAGVPWLGEVPAHWEVRRAKMLFRSIDKRSETGEEELLSVSESDGVIPRRLKNVTMFKAESYVGHKLCWPGDLVINSLWAWKQGLGFSRYHGLVSTAYGVYRPKPTYSSHWRFFDYMLRSKIYAWEFRVRSKGVWLSRLKLTDDDFLDMPIVVPPADEAEHIAAFLTHIDRVTRRYIRAQQRLIELLKEQKQALIQQAVTRGLDPDAPLKASGIEWLGEIPAHWEVRRVKQICRLGYGDSLPSSDRIEGPVPVYGSNGPVGLHDQANTEGPCIIVGRKGSFGKVNYSSVPVFAIDTTFLIDGRFTNANLRWLCYILDWARLDAVTKDSAIPGLDRTEAYSHLVPYCPPKEQKMIAKWLDQRLQDVDLTITRTQRRIDLIREYRTRLIADVVTGKLDVRDAPLPAAALDDDLDDLEDDAALEDFDEIALQEETDE